MSLEKLARGKAEPELKQLVVKAPAEVADEIERISKEKGFSKAEVIVELLKSGLDTYKKVAVKLTRSETSRGD
jgi:hypothetical protein